MTNAITTKLTYLGLVALASVTSMMTPAAAHEAKAAQTVVVAATQLAASRTVRRFRIQRRAIFGCYIKRQRVRLPNGRWVIVERKVCPGPGKLAPRS